jgi:parallel beta-helix repeat protein
MHRKADVAGRAVVVVAAVLVATIAAGCQLVPPEVGSVLIGCSHASERVQVMVTSHLDPSCTYTAGFDIAASDVTLDCQDALIQSAPDAGGVGIQVSSPVTTELSNVTVKNCTVDGFLNSFRITRPGFRDLAAGTEYEHPTANIRAEHNRFRNSRGVGAYVDGYVTGATLKGNTIQDAGSSGIYLEGGSKGSVVDGNVLVHNGYREDGPGGQPFTFAETQFWFWGVGREGISVDGSFENSIVNNVFAQNSNGGVLLYKNCGEFPDSGRYFERRTPSDHNTIAGNTFEDERNGVWIGSRMAENTLPMACTDPAYIDEPSRRVVLDYAKHNVVLDNRFDDVIYGVRVEDDGNQVLHNTFSGPSPDHHAVVVGTPLRSQVLGEPVDGTVVSGNVSTIAGNAHPYRWIHAPTHTSESDNTALGSPVSLCEGQPLPRQPLIFVLAIGLPGPGGTPPATTPDLTVPTVGVLPDCTASV